MFVNKRIDVHLYSTLSSFKNQLNCCRPHCRCHLVAGVTSLPVSAHYRCHPFWCHLIVICITGVTSLPVSPHCRCHLIAGVTSLPVYRCHLIAGVPLISLPVSPHCRCHLIAGVRCLITGVTSLPVSPHCRCHLIHLRCHLIAGVTSLPVSPHHVTSLPVLSGAPCTSLYHLVPKHLRTTWSRP